MKKYIVYKITNKINNMIYVGVHTTDRVNDNYMGSGTNIRNEIKKHGRDNFIKEILYTFDNKEDMLNKEREIVDNKFVSNPNTYNIMLGGGLYYTMGYAIVKNNNENILVLTTDTRYLSKELVGVNNHKTIVRDINGNSFMVDVDDERFLSGELKHVTKGTISVKDKDGNTFRVDKNDERYLNGELVGVWKNRKHSEETKIKMRKSYLRRIKK